MLGTSEVLASGNSLRAFEHICVDIRERISSDSLRPGDKLPTERDMAVQYGVGRNAVREALRSLEIAGLVRLHKGRSGGAFVRPANHSQVTTAFKDLLAYGSITWSELSEARVAVLGAVVRLAAKRATDKDLDDIERNLDETDALTAQGRLAERSHVATDFWSLLASASHNRALLMMISAMTELERQFLESMIRPGNKPIASLVPDRRTFLRHLRRRDGELAASAIRTQLLKIHKILDQKFSSRPGKLERVDGAASAAKSRKPTVRRGAST